MRFSFRADTCARCACKTGIPPHVVHITPPPLAEEFLAPPAPQPLTRSVLFFGRATPEKGLRSLIMAIGSMHAATRPLLRIASHNLADDGEERLLAERNGVQLEMLGWLSQAQLRDAIDHAYIVAFPSMWSEPFGLSGTQALARSRPVVAYDAGGVNEWIEGGGIAVRRGDEGALGEAITRLMTDNDLWNRLAQGARQNAERYRLERHVRVLADIISAHARRDIA